MFTALFQRLRAAWSPPPYVSSRTHHHYHHQSQHQDSSIESLLEPIRYSMAFLTLFSILSSVIIAIVLVPFGALQLLAQFISLIVSLSGLIGTFKRSILLSSIYALSMLLFLFLQCSYFFVLLKLVQEVNLGVNGNSNNLIGDKFMFNSAELTAGGQGVGGFEHYPSPYTLPSSGLDRLGHFVNAEIKAEPSSTRALELSPHLSSHPPPEPYLSLKPSSPLSRYEDSEHFNHYHRPMHVRHISEVLNEELAYLSLLTVPMLAWLPPSLFMESVAVLLLTMQALAGACFLYALRRSESYYRRSAYRHEKLDIEHQAMLSDPT